VKDKWYEYAACYGMSEKNYDPWDENGLDNQDAFPICFICPVRKECLRDSFHDPDMSQGTIRGGLTTEERKAFFRPKARGSCPVCDETLPCPDQNLNQLCADCDIVWKGRNVRKKVPA
jgi:hypothetical protein